jgi:hypothetical protein
VAPVAKRHLVYPEGSPQRALQDVLDARYPGDLSQLFGAIAKRLGIGPKSVSGTYYAVLRTARSLPVEHRKLYIELAGVPTEILDEVERLRASRRRLARFSTVALDEERVREIVREELARAQIGDDPPLPHAASA